VDYHFLTGAEFDAMVGRNELLEWAEVFSNRYGTPRAPVESAMAAGKDVLFDIDWQGTRQIRAAAPQDLVTVFILPPSGAVLRGRLVSRGQDANEVVAERMRKACAEMSHWEEYDYIIVNESLEASLTAIQTVLAAERLKRVRRLPALSGLVARIERELGECQRTNEP
jgi:guanylate kinase